MITIDQLLESVDLDFEPRFVTKDPSGAIAIWAEKPERTAKHRVWIGQTDFVVIHLIKLAEFENKNWTECIYEVPRKATGNIQKLTETGISKDGDVPSLTSTVSVLNIIINRLNDVIDAVNELKGANNE